MKILVVGSGGREHTLVWKLRKSPLVKKIFATPGNPGIGLIANTINIKADNIKGLTDFAGKNRIDLTVVGPEAPLTMGIVDEFKKRKLNIFGPSRAAAEIEGSKAFAKEFMRKYHVPTAPFQIFENSAEAISFVRSAPIPIVIKADGLAAGKGAIVARSLDEAIEAIERIMVDRVFGAAGDKVIIETFLEGQELSVMAFSDGKNIKMMLPSQDHKQIGEGDTGPNTGGMGAYCPVGFVDDSVLAFIKDHILEPTITGLKKEGREYRGVLYAGLMLTTSGPKVVEFNCRFGDPEAQVVLPLLDSDLADILVAVVDGDLSLIDEPKWSSGAAACVVLASKGYPGKPETGKRIFGLRNYGNRNCYLFHAGTRREGKNWITSGGRVVGVTAVDDNLKSALAKAYDVIDGIRFDGVVFRSDIGFKADLQVKMVKI